MAVGATREEALGEDRPDPSQDPQRSSGDGSVYGTRRARPRKSGVVGRCLRLSAVSLRPPPSSVAHRRPPLGGRITGIAGSSGLTTYLGRALSPHATRNAKAAQLGVDQRLRTPTAQSAAAPAANLGARTAAFGANLGWRHRRRQPGRTVSCRSAPPGPRRRRHQHRHTPSPHPATAPGPPDLRGSPDLAHRRLEGVDISRAGRSGGGSRPDGRRPPDLLAGRLFFGCRSPPARALLEAALPPAGAAPPQACSTLARRLAPHPAFLGQVQLIAIRN